MTDSQEGMSYATWEPVYRRILADFRFDPEADERARDVLDSLCEDSAGTVIDSMCYEGETVAIAGAAPGLGDELDRARRADSVVAASAAAEVLSAAELDVDCVVTDLDGTPEHARELSEDGIPVAVHAHGDNVGAVRQYVPGFDHGRLIPTTQAEPRGVVRNFGGFTDGDRAAFLADALGADRLVFPGWEFDDPTVSDMKRRKLRWAERLLYWLEQRRGDSFAVLDGRRETIDTSALPV